MRNPDVTNAFTNKPMSACRSFTSIRGVYYLWCDYSNIIYVYLYVCMCACMYNVHFCVCACVWVCAWARACVWVYMHLVYSNSPLPLGFEAFFITYVCCIKWNLICFLLVFMFVVQDNPTTVYTYVKHLYKDGISIVVLALSIH